MDTQGLHGESWVNASTNVSAGQFLAVLCLLFLVACGKGTLSPSIAFSAELPGPLADISMRPSGACSVDTINDQLAGKMTQISKASNLRVGGWAAIPATGSVPVAVLIDLRSADRRSHYYAVAKSGLMRPDVAKALETPAFETSGFNLSSKLDAVPAGKYDVNVILFDGSAGLVCFGKKKLQVQ